MMTRYQGIQIAIMDDKYHALQRARSKATKRPRALRTEHEWSTSARKNVSEVIFTSHGSLAFSLHSPVGTKV
jgi:hypothetical protein